MSSVFISLVLAIGTLLGGCQVQSPELIRIEPRPDAEWEAVQTEMKQKTTAHRLETPPVLDGILEDACWQGIEPVGRFTEQVGVPAEANEWVTMRIARTEQALYFGGRLKKAGKIIRAAVSNDYGKVWMDDSLEIFLYQPEKKICYQIDVNALGAFWAGSNPEANWHPQLTVKAARDEDGWNVEVELPWKDLGIEKPDAASLLMQVRYLVNMQAGWTAWAPGTDPEKYGILLFSSDGDSGELIQVRRFLFPRRLAAGNHENAFGVEVENVTAKPRKVMVRLFDSDRRTGGISNNWQNYFTIPPKEKKTIFAATPMPRTGKVSKQLLVASGQKHLLQKIRWVETLPSLRFSLHRERVWRGDPVLTGDIEVGLESTERKEVSLRLELWDRKHMLAEKSLSPVRANRYAVTLNLRGLEPGPYKLILSLGEGKKKHEVITDFNIQEEMPLPARRKVELKTNWPEECVYQGYTPLYAGVSFPGGMLLDENQVRVVDENGKEIPCQSEVLSRWGPEGSIKWLGIHFLGKKESDYYIEFGKEVGRGRVKGPTISIEDSGAAFLVDTGAGRFELPKIGPLCGQAWIGKEKVLEGGSACLVLTDQNGRVADETRGDASESPVIEVSGPLYTVIRREGSYRTSSGERLGKYVVRLCFYAGVSFVKAQHSLILTEDTKKIQFSDIALCLKPAFAGPWNTALDNDPAYDSRAFEVSIEPAKGEGARMAQLSYKHHGQDIRECTVGVRKDGEWKVADRGEECGEWGRVTGNRVGVAIAVRNFTETFPKEIEVAPQGLIAHLWSSRGNRNLDYRASTLVDYYGREWLSHSRGGGAEKFAGLQTDATGTARTHDITVHIFSIKDQDSVPSVAHLSDQPPLVIQDPAWLRKSEAMGPLHPYDTERFPRAEKFIETFFKYFAVDQASYWGDYGFLDYGAGPHLWGCGAYDYREAYRRPNDKCHLGYPFVGYRYVGADMYRIRTTPWRLYARSGNRMYFGYGDAMNRFLADFHQVHHGTKSKPLGALITSSVAQSFPLYWAGTPTLVAHGQDIDNFFYQYYLTGDRWINETVQLFARYMKEHFEPDGLRLRNGYVYQPYLFLASLYEATWDECLGEKLRGCRREILDLETTVGLYNWDYMTCWYKWGAFLYAPFRDYQVTGSHLARDAFLKGAAFCLHHGPAGRQMGYYDHLGAYLYYAYRLTGDPRYASHGRENLLRRLFWMSDESGNTLKMTPYTGHWSVQGLETTVFLMSLVAEAEDVTQPCPVLPRLIPGSAQIQGAGQSNAPPDIYFSKDWNETARFRLQYEKDFDIQVAQLLQPKRKQHQGGYFLGPLHFDAWLEYFTKTPDAGLGGGVGDLLVPKEAMPAHYRLKGVRSILWADVPGLVAAIPEEGLYLPIESAEPKMWYFLLPAGKSGAVMADRPVFLKFGDTTMELKTNEWHEIHGLKEDVVCALWPGDITAAPFIPDKRPRPFYLKNVNPRTLLRFKGEIPPVLAPDHPDRLFLPECEITRPPEAGDEAPAR